MKCLLKIRNRPLSFLVQIMHVLVLFWFFILSTTASGCQNSRSQDVLEPSSSGNDSSNNSISTAVEIEEKIMELRKEMVRFQILSNVDMEETPPSAQPATEASREIIRLLLREEEEQSRRQLFRLDDSQEKLVIHAKGNGQPCLQHNGSFCKMFRYELDASVNMSAVDIWIYKVAALPKWVTISLTLSSSSENKYHENRYYEVVQTGWRKLQLPRIQLPSSWNDSVLYSAEIIGQSIEDTGNRRPFLMVTKHFLVPVRQRRDVNCNTNESCCLKPLRVSLVDIGFNWVLYPEEIEANMCTGKCTMDQSATMKPYEIAMTKVLERDSSLQASLGECWTLCCKPKELSPVQLIYEDMNGTIHDRLIAELRIKSCGCSYY